jgi:hypothetical protein
MNAPPVFRSRWLPAPEETPHTQGGVELTETTKTLSVVFGGAGRGRIPAFSCVGCEAETDPPGVLVFPPCPRRDFHQIGDFKVGADGFATCRRHPDARSATRAARSIPLETSPDGGAL